MSIPKVLTIAGSDSGGCAGIQADLKTFGALRTHGMSAVTSVTAQDTSRVHMATDLPVATVEKQIRAVIDDIGADAVKTGMLSSREIIAKVSELMREYAIERLVVDPVMASTAGDPLIRPEAVKTLTGRLFPLALTVTPNLRETELLTGIRVQSESDVNKAARRILAQGPRSVVIKGGHFDDPGHCTDYLFLDSRMVKLVAERIDTRNTHGSGCTFASAIAAYLARGLDLEEAVKQAKNYVSQALRHSLDIGRGRGPLGHFWQVRGGRE